MTSKTKATPLTLEQIVPGQRVRQIQNPEYGDWMLKEHAHGGTWNVTRWDWKRTGTISVCVGELTRYWEVVEAKPVRLRSDDYKLKMAAL